MGANLAPTGSEVKYQNCTYLDDAFSVYPLTVKPCSRLKQLYVKSFYKNTIIHETAGVDKFLSNFKLY